MNMKWEGWCLKLGKVMVACVGSTTGGLEGTTYWYECYLPEAAECKKPYESPEAAMQAAEEAVLKWLREVMGEPVAFVGEAHALLWHRFSPMLEHGTDLFALPEVKP